MVHLYTSLLEFAVVHGGNVTIAGNGLDISVLLAGARNIICKGLMVQQVTYSIMAECVLCTPAHRSGC
ncbi:hypothetical protein AHAS_Ahas13G0330400 [Arachis hypogaea]